MRAIDAIVPCIRLDEKWHKQAFEWVLDRISKVGVRQVVVVEQNPQGARSYASAKIQHVQMEMKNDNFWRGDLINAGFQHTEDADYIWVVDFNMRLDFQGAFDLIGDQEFIQPYRHVALLDREQSWQVLFQGVEALPKDKILDTSIGEGSFIVQRSLFEDVGKMNTAYGGSALGRITTSYGVPGLEGVEFGHRVSKGRTVHRLRLDAGRFYSPGMAYELSLKARSQFEEMLANRHGEPKIEIVGEDEPIEREEGLIEHDKAAITT